ncbi:transglycosylase domain-containing protein [Bacillus suaedaesalsae]|uniref:PBP1A family penicillin-binding protein n=1 Tax=Bacillus suaedaesalsae TaxID=2810349 RepID=A0ABS2DCV7_9BACI|nr:PBP1A family penicillin-binding protein [Bacillus suaedaesalsae]MBM6616294.1 PBP1A family penicillin-binding protein [Bacillus suaedaesalsae]
MSRIERKKRLTNSKFTQLKLKNQVLFAVVALGLIGILVLNLLIQFSDVSKLENPEPIPTLIFDKDGEIASSISNSKIEGVKLEQISPHLIHAVIATEDQRFYKHNGLNYVGIARALFNNVTSGEIVGGGSTITQQLSKNAFLTHEQTYTRKFKEVFITKKIERTYSKDEILERYLNQIYFGEGSWGIGRASQVYFGKAPSDLNINEAATLAGLLKAPTHYSPYKNMELSQKRRDIVLGLMKEEGYISQAEMEKAKREPIALSEKEVEDYKGRYPYYVDKIIEEAVEKYNISETEILSGGLRIYTEMNASIQKVAEQVYREENNFPQSTSDQIVQSGSVFINPKTGGIVALVGGRGEFSYGGFNRATDLVRQPGSTMKPLAVYTPALEKGYELYDSLLDRPIRIGTHEPKNYDGQYRGEVSMYDAVVNSYNIPAVWLMYQVGLDQAMISVERFGIPLVEKDRGPGIALGGMNEGTSPLAMAQAFSTFPNEGEMIEAHAITKIENVEGQLIASWKETATKVTDERVAQKMNYMLKGVVDKGTGRKAQVAGFDVAGKTGTTEVPFEGTNGGSKDHWFIGYTPTIVGAVWLGYDDTNKNNYLTSSSSQTATVLFQKILEGSKAEIENENFNFTAVAKYAKEYEKKKEQEEKQKHRKEKDKGKGKGRDKEGENNGKGKGKKKDDDDEDEKDDDEEDDD